MPHDNWRDAVAAIRDALGTVTATQKKLASVAGITLPDSLPHLVAAARLKSSLSAELSIQGSSPCTDVQHEIIRDLQSEGAVVLSAPLNRDDADAWIHVLRLNARLRALERLKIEAGDIVKRTESRSKLVAEVASISSSGRIYFKGGQGAGAWPDTVTVCARKNDSGDDAQQFRSDAANQVALRARATGWSVAKRAELQDYLVRASITRADVEALRETIEAAGDERPIQQLIEARPQLLTSLLSGNERYCLPHPRFGGDLVPDFLVSDVDSLGVRWLLIELETPMAELTLQTDNMLAKHARKGVSQVEEWREWLQNNLNFARRSTSDGGLGLANIRPGSDGLVLVGRRERLNDNETAVRQRLREGSNIHVHTYDWLLERLEGTLTFSGPPALNPHVLTPTRQ